FKYEDWLIIVEAGIKKDEIATEEKTQRAEAVPDEQGPKAPEAIEAIEAPVEKENTEKQEQDNSRNIDFIMDIPLPVTVELGRNKMKINDLLKMGNGAVVELEQVEGEPVDILVNETLIAKGHVVVEKEKYGIRICEIISRKERVNSFK
ncbi:MAG: flagellar motor switch protein FliN, partial [Desulfobacteraceae bacterium]|nr:flagellar motor switch protein FliN [Desulfobacteraceae bacterium]